MSKMVDLEELIQCIQDSVTTVDVLVRSRGFCYYEGDSDSSETTITYIDPQKMIENLEIYRD